MCNVKKYKCINYDKQLTYISIIHFLHVLEPNDFKRLRDLIPVKVATAAIWLCGDYAISCLTELRKLWEHECTHTRIDNLTIFMTFQRKVLHVVARTGTGSSLADTFELAARIDAR